MAGTAAAGAGPPWISRSPSRKNLDKRAAVSAAATMRSVARAPQWKTFEGRTFFLDNQHISEDARKRLGDRLKNLGALVTPFLDSDIDCVVATNTGTPSAPSTPTGGSTSTRGISLRAQLILNSNNSKTGAGTGTLQTTPAQFAESHGKHVLSARALEALLAAEEQRREHDSQLRAECSNKRSRAGPNSNDNAEDGSPPKCPRHTVRVRGIDTEYCKARPGIPEWWHFPECDRNYYFAPGEDAGSNSPAAALNRALSASRSDKREDTRKDNGERRQKAGDKEKVKQVVKGGYCAMCKVKHDNAKKHADSKGHRVVLQKIMAQKTI